MAYVSFCAISLFPGPYCPPIKYPAVPRPSPNDVAAFSAVAKSVSVAADVAPVEYTVFSVLSVRLLASLPPDE